MFKRMVMMKKTIYLMLPLALILFSQCSMRKELITESGLQYKITKKGKGKPKTQR